MKQIALEGFLKKHRNISRTSAKVKIELLVALVCILVALVCSLFVTKNLNVGAIGVLNTPLEYYNVL